MKSTVTWFLLLSALVVAAQGKKPNFKKIIRHVNAGDYTWKAAENHVTAMGSKARVLAGALLPQASERSLPVKPLTRLSSIPKSFDSREEWSTCDSIWSIKDQGDCGTCWAVSTSSVMSDRVCIASSASVQVNISAQQLAACCVDCGMGCNGGYPDKAWPFFFEHGLVTGGAYDSAEGCQPYEVPPSGAPTDAPEDDEPYLICHPKKCTNKKYTTAYKKDLHYGKTSYALPNDVESIQAEIMTNGPVVAGFNVYSDFITYSSGVYQYVTGDLEGGHAVRVLGWGVENKTDYWLVANSWSRDWGENGLFKIIRGSNNCQFEENMTAGLVEGS